MKEDIMKSKQFRNLFLATLLSGTALASASALADSKFDGAYAGIQGGYSIVKGKTTVKGFKEGNTTFKDQRKNLDLNGFDFGLFGGYGQAVSGNFYLGGELEIGYNTGSDKAKYEEKIDANNKRSGSYKMSRGMTYGASLRPGFIVGENTLVYGRIGLALSHFELKANGDKSTIAGATSTKGQANIKQDKYLTGLRLGGGVEHAIADNMTLRGEYVYTKYGKFSSSKDQLNITMKPQEHTFRFGVAYGF